MVRIDILFPQAAIVADGIGDHTRTLASALAAQGCHVRVLSRGESTAPTDYEMIDAWPGARLSDLTHLRQRIEADPPDLLLLQFEQFSYGPRGFNLRLPLLFTWMRRHCPATLRVLYAHEAYTAPGTLGHTAMWAYQKGQAAILTSTADYVLHSSLRGLHLLGGFNPQSVVLPVFSNVAVLSKPSASRLDYGIPESALVVLVFGHLDEVRRSLIRDAFAAISIVRPEAVLVYVGKDAAGAATLVADSTRLLIFPSADSGTVSTLMLHADLALAPFSDGVSARRGSFAALLLHSVPTVTTSGRFTDEYLVNAAADGAFVITETHAPAFTLGALSLAASGEFRADIRRQASVFASSLPSPATTARSLLDLLHKHAAR